MSSPRKVYDVVKSDTLYRFFSRQLCQPRLRKYMCSNRGGPASLTQGTENRDNNNSHELETCRAISHVARVSQTDRAGEVARSRTSTSFLQIFSDVIVCLHRRAGIHQAIAGVRVREGLPCPDGKPCRWCTGERWKVGVHPCLCSKALR